jgi:L-ribulose-5-phosphate 4-epimerase
MLEQLKTQLCRANLDLVKEGLVVQTWSNASGIDRDKGLVVIKPSGVHYSQMQPRHMVVVALDSGKVVEGKLNPSSDTVARPRCCPRKIRRREPSSYPSAGPTGRSDL